MAFQSGTGILELVKISKIPAKHSFIQKFKKKLMSFKGKGTKNIPYVIWDGSEETLYDEHPVMQDILYLENEKSILKIQNLRKALISSGYLVTIIFSCKSQTYSYPARFEFDGEWHDVFGHCFSLVQYFYPEATYREIISKTNTAIKKTGVFQQSEIICRRDLLDHKFKKKIRSEVHHILVFDMCRL
jgi:hypothetical protein